MTARAALMQRLAAVETAVAAERAAAPPDPFRHMSEREEVSVKRTIRAYEDATTLEQQFIDMIDGKHPRTFLLPSGPGILETATVQQVQDIYDAVRMKLWPHRRRILA